MEGRKTIGILTAEADQMLTKAVEVNLLYPTGDQEIKV